jgi:hypothetical protein
MSIENLYFLTLYSCLLHPFHCLSIIFQGILCWFWPRPQIGAAPIWRAETTWRELSRRPRHDEVLMRFSQQSWIIIVRHSLVHRWCAFHATPEIKHLFADRKWSPLGPNRWFDHNHYPHMNWTIKGLNQPWNICWGHTTIIYYVGLSQKRAMYH